MAVDFGLEGGGERLHRRRIRPRFTGRRHHAGAQLTQHLLGDGGFLVRRARIKHFEFQAALGVRVVVAVHAVLVDHLPLRGHGHRAVRRRRCR